jgi:D-glycero-D-manno-heptose 1,7-bisphosphate phosphatase
MKLLSIDWAAPIIGLFLLCLVSIHGAFSTTPYLVRLPLTLSPSAIKRALFSSLSSSDYYNDSYYNNQEPFVGHSLAKLVLLDRDGVINQDVGSPGVTRPEQLALTPNAGSAMLALRNAGYKIALISNQSCVGKGLMTRHELDDIFDTLQDLLLKEQITQEEEDPNAFCTSAANYCCPWDALYISTTTVDVPDPRRKPNPGMILEACQDFGVSPQDCIFIGDTLTDLQAATSARVPLRMLVSTGYGSGLLEECGIDQSKLVCNNDCCVISSTDDDDHDLPLFLSKAGQDTHGMYEKLQKVMPFVYTKNLDSALQCLIQKFPATKQSNNIG